MNNEEVNDHIIGFGEVLDEHIEAEYGEEAKLEDGKNFTKSEVLDMLDGFLRSREVTR